MYLESHTVSQNDHETQRVSQIDNCNRFGDVTSPDMSSRPKAHVVGSVNRACELVSTRTGGTRFTGSRVHGHGFTSSRIHGFTALTTKSGGTPVHVFTASHVKNGDSFRRNNFQQPSECKAALMISNP